VRVVGPGARQFSEMGAKHNEKWTSFGFFGFFKGAS
jgi:hypothetical protein